MLAVTLGLFAPAVGFGPVYEDHRETRLTLDPDLIGHQIRLQPFRTLTHLSRALDMAVFGIQPWGFHLGSILWHLVNTLLVLAIAWLVLPPWGAIAAAGFFAWHPIQVEAVVYVSARSDLIAAVGILLAVFAASLGSMAGAVVGVCLACVGKESAVVAWGLVPLWAAWARVPAWSWLRWFAISGTGGLVVLIWAISQIRDWPVVFDSVLAGHQLAVIWRLLALVVVPWGFAVDHDWAALAWLGPGAFLLSAGVTAWAVTEGWRRRSWVAFGWLWTLIALSPRLVVPTYEGLHEHHFYVVLIGWCLCVGYWLSASTRERGAIWQAGSQI